MTIWKWKVYPLAIHNLNFTCHVSMRGRGHVRLWLTISAVIQPYRQRMFQFRQSYNPVHSACFNFTTAIQPCRQRMFQFQHSHTTLSTVLVSISAWSNSPMFVVSAYFNFSPARSLQVNTCLNVTIPRSHAVTVCLKTCLNFGLIRIGSCC